MGERPRIFVSSTIYDFRDLRSSIKFYLEEHGYDVQLSEFNDFTKELDRSSFDACLESVTKADYYVLLIGKRVGGLYDSAERISITRMEYRCAYDCFKTSGHPRLIMLVRGDVWDLREDRKGLERLLDEDWRRENEVPDDQVARVFNHSSNHINDAKSTFDFLREVTRSEEMRRAQITGGPFPPANWVHTFTTFRDVVDVFKGSVIARRPLMKLTVEANLRHELATVIAALSHLHKGDLFFDHWWAEEMRGRMPKSDMLATIPAGQTIALSLWMLSCRRGVRMPSDAGIERAIESGVFLEFDPDKGEYRAGLVQRSLIALRAEIQRLRYLEQPAGELVAACTELVNASKSKRDANIRGIDLAVAMAMADCHHNIVFLSRGLFLALDGELSMLSGQTLRPSTPYPDHVEAVEAAIVSLDDAVRFLRDGLK